MGNEIKKGLNTNSNTYTIIYSVIIVVVVAFLLAFVSKGLEEKQNENVALDKKKQILYSLNIRGLKDQEATNKYNEVVLKDNIIDEEGNILELGEKGGINKGFRLNSADTKAGRLAIFECNIDGKKKFVVPVYGMGLWGPISGYISINEDCKTIYGAYFNHESETAGLGAEIKDNEDWQKSFKDKLIFDEEGKNVILSVNKKVDNPKSQVDAITGATLTSDGVSLMLQDGLKQYSKFFYRSQNN
jgi:Na+-transporting NADH:ubiquinone oxidoreductase subunit C